jgi:DNA-binding response OmpR family regulator
MISRILILEDDTHILELMESILEDEGYYTIALDHYLPVEDLMDLSPDLVLLDIRLSNGYGHLLCKDLKANPVTSKIPVVLISGSANLDTIAKECNADGFLNKPFSVEGLISIVKNLQ